jgi:acetate kinase
MSDVILTLNAGSATLKYGLYEAGGARIGGGKIEPITPSISDDIFAQVEAVLGAKRPSIVGHRIVHGGRDFIAPVHLDSSAVSKLELFSPLAPLHQPQCLALVRTIASRYPDVPQIGCFDTAFHATLAPEAWRYALPRDLESVGIRRYGFHGLSYEYIVGRMRDLKPDQADGRIVIAHLGAGSSLCATRHGRSVDTSMGFTPLDGLAMASRCGALDPGVVLYLLEQMRMTPAQIRELLYRKSGLLGVSGISGDMRVLLQSGDAGAREAVDLYVYRVAREIGALVSSLGGLDGLVFTGGIGENAPEIRRRICARLSWLGIALDEEENTGNAVAIGSTSSANVWVIPTDEESIIAREACIFLS